MAGLRQHGPGGRRPSPAVTPPLTPFLGHPLPASVCCRLTQPRPRSQQDPGGDGFGTQAREGNPLPFFLCLLTPCSALPSAFGRRRPHETPKQRRCACHPSCSPAAHPGDAETTSASCSCPDKATGRAEEKLPSPSSQQPAPRLSPGGCTCWWQLPGHRLPACPSISVEAAQPARAGARSRCGQEKPLIHSRENRTRFSAPRTGTRELSPAGLEGKGQTPPFWR